MNYNATSDLPPLAPAAPSSYLVYMPTYAPGTEAVANPPEGARNLYERQFTGSIMQRTELHPFLSRLRPWVYMDCIDSILNTRPDVDLIVADARSTDSIRAGLHKHQQASLHTPAAYSLALFEEKASQWWVMNYLLRTHATPATKYVVYTSSDIIWTMDWLAAAEKEFDADPSLQIVFPCVSAGDPAMPLQVSSSARDLDLIDPAHHLDSEGVRAARAPCLNMYAAVFRMEFFKTYGGYPTAFRNCFTESFLYYMCQAMGGKMRLMPRGWVFHHSALDAWEGEGGSYNYTAEKPLFDQVMNEVQMMCGAGEMTTRYLKEKLCV